jgi:hypothetical protein
LTAPLKAYGKKRIAYGQQLKVEDLRLAFKRGIQVLRGTKYARERTPVRQFVMTVEGERTGDLPYMRMGDRELPYSALRSRVIGRWVWVPSAESSIQAWTGALYEKKVYEPLALRLRPGDTKTLWMSNYGAKDALVKFGDRSVTLSLVTSGTGKGVTTELWVGGSTLEIKPNASKTVQGLRVHVVAVSSKNRQPVAGFPPQHVQLQLSVRGKK